MFIQLLLGPADPTEEAEREEQASSTYDEVLSMLVALLTVWFSPVTLEPSVGAGRHRLALTWVLVCTLQKVLQGPTKGSQPSGFLLLALPTQQAACW